MRVELIGIGRNRVNRSFHFESWDHVYAEVRKHLRSRDVDIRFNDEQTEGHVFVGGFRSVGVVLLVEDLPPEGRERVGD